MADAVSLLYGLFWSVYQSIHIFIFLSNIFIAALQLIHICIMFAITFCVVKSLAPFTENEWSLMAFLGVRVLVDAREKLHIPWGDPDNQVHGETIMAFDTRSSLMAKGMVETKVFLNYLPTIRALWQDSSIQNAYDRRREFQLVSVKCCSAFDPKSLFYLFSVILKQSIGCGFSKVWASEG